MRDKSLPFLMPSKSYIISVMSEDRVGIVADVSGAIRKLNGNLKDLSQTVMRGYFTMIVLAYFPEEMDGDALRKALHAIRKLSRFEIGVLPYHELPNVAPPSQEDTYVLTASGPDQPGLVFALSSFLCEKGINILDLSTKMDSKGHYIMMFLVSLPEGTDVSKLKHSLQLAVESQHLAVELRNQAIFHKTNEI